MSRPRSAHVPAVSRACLYCSEATLLQLRACSPIAPRSSEPAFGASSMPSPAPSTVPVSRPIMNPPPPPSLSYRSKLSAIVCSSLYWPALSIPTHWTIEFGIALRVFGRTSRCAPSGVKEPIDRRACCVEQRNGALHPRIDRRADAPRRFVNAVDRLLNGGIHPFRSSADPCRHVAQISENRIHARNQRVRTR